MARSRGASQNAVTARASQEGGVHVTALQRPSRTVQFVYFPRSSLSVTHPTPLHQSRPLGLSLVQEAADPHCRGPCGPGSPRPRRSFLCPGASAAAAELGCRRGGRALPGAPAPSRGHPGRGGGARGKEVRGPRRITAHLGQLTAPAPALIRVEVWDLLKV